MKKKSVCPLDCPDSCGIVATVKNGMVISLTGDKDHPVTQGVICRKVRKYCDRLYSKNRLTTPLLRVGEKGSGDFKRIGWDEAWDILTRKLTQVIDEFGGESVLPFCYAGNMGRVNRNAGYPFFHRIGATQIEQTICSAAANGGWKKHCGKVPGSPAEKAEDSDVIVCWGLNAKVSSIHFWQNITKAKKKGAKLVVIDPYKNMTAKSADLYVAVKPAGDSGLALGILKYLLSENKIDLVAVNAFCDGFGPLQKYLANTPMALFLDQAGVSFDDLKSLADLLYTHPKTFVRIGVGLTRNSRGGVAMRAIISLAAALQLFSKGEGRGVLCFSGAYKGGNEQLVHKKLLKSDPRTINMIHLGKALTSMEPPIKALIVYNANPLSVAPDSGSVRKGMLREDLFTVVHEQVMTPTAQYADLVLPATTFLENRDLYSGYGHYYMQTVEPAISPIGESLSNFDFFQQLATRMGYTDPQFSQTTEDRMKLHFREIDGIPESVTVEDFMNGELIVSTYRDCYKDLFLKNGKRFQFTDLCCGADDFPKLIDSKEFDDPDLISRYPFKIITPPHLNLLNSTFGERYEGDVGELLIHPDDAEKYLINTEDTVILINSRGKTTRKALVTKNTSRGLLVAEGLFWPAEKSCGINELTSQKVSDICGGAIFHESRVRIEKA